jgi:hypothetical protein
MAQVNRESVGDILDILKERYDNLINIITKPGVDDSVYEINTTRMILAIADLRKALKLIRVG